MVEGLRAFEAGGSGGCGEAGLFRDGGRRGSGQEAGRGSSRSKAASYAWLGIYG